MSVRLQKFSYRFAEQIFSNKLSLKNEREEILYASSLDLSKLTRPGFNKLLEQNFISVAAL